MSTSKCSETEVDFVCVCHVGLEVNAERMKYVFMSYHQIAEQTCNVKAFNKFFKILSELRYFGTTATNQRCILEELKNRLNLGSALYHAVQNLVYSQLIPKTF
jgi:hypothetical protein